jgi:hypothetical protein
MGELFYLIMNKSNHQTIFVGNPRILTGIKSLRKENFACDDVLLKGQFHEKSM